MVTKWSEKSNERKWSYLSEQIAETTTSIALHSWRISTGITKQHYVFVYRKFGNDIYIPFTFDNTMLASLILQQMRVSNKLPIRSLFWSL